MQSFYAGITPADSIDGPFWKIIIWQEKGLKNYFIDCCGHEHRF